MIHGDILVLSDAVGAVGGLLLDGGIPPWVEMKDVVGTGEVESQPSGFQTDEEHWCHTMLEVGHHFLATADGGGTVQIQQLFFSHTLLNFYLDHGQEGGELTEYQYAVACFHNLVHQVGGGVDF